MQIIYLLYYSTFGLRLKLLATGLSDLRCECISRNMPIMMRALSEYSDESRET
jgi:hypothetical protein